MKNKTVKCKKCGRTKIKLNLELTLCGCPMDESSERLLKEILENNDKKKRGEWK